MKHKPPSWEDTVRQIEEKVETITRAANGLRLVQSRLETEKRIVEGDRRVMMESMANSGSDELLDEVASVDLKLNSLQERIGKLQEEAKAIKEGLSGLRGLLDELQERRLTAVAKNELYDGELDEAFEAAGKETDRLAARAAALMEMSRT